MTADIITANHDVQALSDRELLERVFRHLEHLDAMVHETHQMVAELRPLVPHIPRALALLDPMGKIRKGRRNAVPLPEAAPVHVGPAPAHSQEVGT